MKKIVLSIAMLLGFVLISERLSANCCPCPNASCPNRLCQKLEACKTRPGELCFSLAVLRTNNGEGVATNLINGINCPNCRHLAEEHICDKTGWFYTSDDCTKKESSK